MVWRELKSIQLKNKDVFLLTFNKLAIQNNPLMQLHQMFHKTVNKNKLKVSKFQSHRISSFSAIKRTVTGVEGGGVKFVLFLSLILSVHINFQNKLNSDIFFYCNCQFIFFYSYTLFFSSATSLLFFPYKFNGYE